MKFSFNEKKQVEVKYLQVCAGVRYWEDAKVNGKEDELGDLIPCREKGLWKPRIGIDEGKILNWKKGVRAEIHYKVCDSGKYDLLDEDGEVVYSKDGYVPEIMCPEGNGYGDYIIMKVNENGYIANWDADLSDFEEED
jgi:hypothetical protein